MRIVRIRGKSYRWSIEDMHPVVMWAAVAGIMAITVIGLWGAVMLPVVVLGR